MSARGRLAVALAALSLGCSERRETPSTTTEQSPNAAILPAPLASTADLSSPPAQAAGSARVGIAADSAGRLLVREQEPPPPETAPATRPLPQDSLTTKDGVGYTIEGTFRFADLPPPLSVPEAAPAAIHDAAAKAELSLTVDLASIGRMRVVLASPAFPLPANTEIRAKTSWYGHVLMWPNGAQYRVLSPGSLRAMFAERRADVVPLLRGKVTPGDAGTLLGHKTLRSKVETALGVLTLEQASVPGSGAGGELWCRLLVEFVGAEPTTEACRAERIPVAAQYRWSGGGSLSFTATSFMERKDLPVGYLYVPPPGAAFSPGELPPTSSGVFFTREELAKFRTRAAKSAAPPSARAPGEGITFANQTTELQYLVLDGVPVAWVRPSSEQYVIGPLAGRYGVSWRDFFGAAVTPSTPTDLPAFVRAGSTGGDAGARP